MGVVASNPVLVLEFVNSKDLLRFSLFKEPYRKEICFCLSKRLLKLASFSSEKLTNFVTYFNVKQIILPKLNTSTVGSLLKSTTIVNLPLSFLLKQGLIKENYLVPFIYEYNLNSSEDFTHVFETVSNLYVGRSFNLFETYVAYNVHTLVIQSSLEIIDKIVKNQYSIKKLVLMNSSFNIMNLKHICKLTGLKELCIMADIVDGALLAESVECLRITNCKTLLVLVESIRSIELVKVFLNTGYMNIIKEQKKLISLSLINVMFNSSFRIPKTVRCFELDCELLNDSAMPLKKVMQHIEVDSKFRQLSLNAKLNNIRGCPRKLKKLALGSKARNNNLLFSSRITHLSVYPKMLQNLSYHHKINMRSLKDLEISCDFPEKGTFIDEVYKKLEKWLAIELKSE